MTREQLQNLVKSYTNGETALEVYREQRRKIVDDYTGANIIADEPDVESNENDPLKSFPVSETKKSSKSSIPTLPSSKHKNLYIAAAASVILLVVIIIFQMPEMAPEKPETTSEYDKKSSIEITNRVQVLVENLSMLPQWDDNSINQFILDWQILPAQDKRQAQNEAWFLKFKTELKNRLMEQQALADTGDNSALQLTGMITSVLATIDPNFLIAEPVKIAEAEHSESVTNEIIENSHAKPEPQPIATEKAESKKPEKTVTKKAPTTAKISKATIDIKQYTKLLENFERSFEIGNIDELMKLFSENASTNHHSSAKEIRESYVDLFSTTSNRNLEFDSFNWSMSKSQIEGSGKYLAQLNPKGTNIDQIFSADVSITIDQKENTPLIKNLYLNNQQFSTSLRAIPEEKTAVAKSQPPELNGPADDELNFLINQFQDTYNSGNINGLMALFADKAHTNDRTSIDGIREDYLQLFSATKSRKISIKDLTWKLAGKKAIGTGAFEVKIQATSNTRPKVYKGQIRISATKFEKGVRITQLLHNTK